MVLLKEPCQNRSMDRAMHRTRDILGRLGVGLALLAWFAIPRTTSRCCAMDGGAAAETAASPKMSACCCAAGDGGACVPGGAVAGFSSRSESSSTLPANPDAPAGCHGCPAACCGKVIPVPVATPALQASGAAQFVVAPVELTPDHVEVGGIFHPPRD
jgi:hypothetical protein